MLFDITADANDDNVYRYHGTLYPPSDVALYQPGQTRVFVARDRM
jgi:hypothetical protein